MALESIELGFILPCILGTAFVLWSLGLRDPFLLTLLSLVIGGAVGTLLNYVLSKWIERATR